MKRVAPLLMAGLLAACHQPTAPAAPKATAAEHGYIAKVEALPEGQREMVLFGAIRKGGGQNGEACQGVTKIETMPPTKTGQPTWRATCAEGSQWMVTLSDDGTALVTGARDENPAAS